MTSAQEIIDALGLEPHPEEGGYFRETHRSVEEHAAGHLPDRYPGSRAYGTAIYYLLTPQTFSHLHRLKSEEIFHFYLGDPCEMLHLFPDGRQKVVTLGQDIINGQCVQQVVPAGVWQGMRLLPGGKFALLGCTVAPGFEYEDYEHANRNILLQQYSESEKLIRLLTL